MDLFATSKQTNLLPCDGEVIHWGFLYDLATCGELFEELRHTIDWQNDVLVIFGKKIVTTRKVAWYGDNNLQYSYSNTIKTALPWTETLDKIKADVFKLSGLRFNSCLLNLYPSGMEGMGWHSDDEPELGENPVIASLSLGATRKFKFRHKLNKQKAEVLLDAGTLLIMQGTTQEYWAHQIPKTRKVHTPRINLTFRSIK